MILRLFILSFLLSSCSHSFDVSTSQGRLKKAEYLSQSGQYIEARKNFENILHSSAPYNIKASAQWGLAEISFKREEFIQSELEYNQGLQLFSQSLLAKKFQYKKALSLYKQLPIKYQRDLSLAPKAILQLQYFINAYPKDTLSTKARKNITKIQDLLNKKAFYIANFYFSQKKFKAAAKKFQDLSKNHLTAKVLYKTSLSTYKAGSPSWTYYYKKLTRLFPKSTEAAKLKSLLYL